MTAIIVVNSFRRGDGRSSLVANLSGILAASGYRVCAVDADLQGPGLEVFFKPDLENCNCTLNLYLDGACDILEAACDVTPVLGGFGPGKISLVRASSDPIDIIQSLRKPVDFDRFEQGMAHLARSLSLDYIVVDTMAGINAATLVLLATSNRTVVLMRPDPQDYQGASVIVELARTLGAPRLYVALNDAPQNIDFRQAEDELERSYHCPAVGVLPHSEEMLALGSSGILALSQPADGYSIALKRLAEELIR